MRVILLGSGGVGDAFARIAARRSFFEAMVVADYDLARAERTVAAVRERHPDDDRFVAAQVDASDADSVAALVREHQGTHVMNAVDPRFVMPIFDGAYAAGADYLDMAMSLSRPDVEQPYTKIGVKLGDEQFAAAEEWEQAGRLALVGMGVEPGLSDVFARYAADHLFSHIDELGTRDGSNLTVEGYDFAPSFSIWTTIEECLNPPVIWTAERGWYVVEPFSEPEVFDFPGGIGPVECVHVEHEEVLLMPRWIDAQRVTFKYGLGNEFIEVLKTLRKIGLDKTSPVPVKGSPAGGGSPLLLRGNGGSSPRQCHRPGQPARSGGGLPARPGVPRRGDARRHLRRGLGDRHRQGRPAARGVPLPRGRQRRHDERVRRAVRGLADRGQPGRRAGAAGHRRVVRGRAYSVRRRSTPNPSWNCWPARTNPPGVCRSARPVRAA